jgi:NAD(P)H-dependent flavin oxidoreductase YrpB (nitropropane dioxygenase family)
VSSHTLAAFLARDPVTRPDGFVVETSTAGGHNAPPRGRLQLDESGQPVYGPRDRADLDQLVSLGLPFWLAGGYGHAEGLREALAAGAAGDQGGTAFALCQESGLDEHLKDELIRQALAGTLTVMTDPLASPSGYPFKVAPLAGSAADPSVYLARQRICDLGFLRTPYKRDDGSVGYRCPSEPVDAFVRKGGTPEDTQGRMCLCNGLLATVGLGQHRASGPEPALVTVGDDATRVARSLADPSAAHPSWTADDVLAYVLRGAEAPT